MSNSNGANALKEGVQTPLLGNVYVSNGGGIVGYSERKLRRFWRRLINPYCGNKGRGWISNPWTIFVKSVARDREKRRSGDPDLRSVKGEGRTHAGEERKKGSSRHSKRRRAVDANFSVRPKKAFTEKKREYQLRVMAAC